MFENHTKNGESFKTIIIPPKGTGDPRRHNHRCVYYDNLTNGCKCEQLPYVQECFGSAHCDYYKKKTTDITRPPKDFIFIGAKLVHFKYGVLTVDAIYRDEVYLIDAQNNRRKFTKSALRMLYEQGKLTIE